MSDFPTSLDVFTDKTTDDWVDDSHVNLVQEAMGAIQAKIGVGTYFSDLHTLVYNFFATNRKVWLYENAAPTGWSIESVSDVVLGIKGGTGAYNAAGGTTQQGDSWSNLTNHYHDMSHTHPIDNHHHIWTSGGYTYNYDGQTLKAWGSGGIYAVTRIGGGYCEATTRYTNITGGQTSGVASPSNVSYMGTDARPTACVGIVVVKG